MKKIVLTLFSQLIFFTVVFGQYGEFQYFSIRAGINSNFLSAHASASENMFLTTDLGTMKLYDKEKYFDYSLGAFGGVMFHYDFENDKSGLMIGAMYSAHGITSKYETLDGQFDLTETFRMHHIEVPVVIKFGQDFYEEQKYVYAGLQYNYNLSMQQVQTVNWKTTALVSWKTPDEFKESNIGLVFGFNYLVFNFELNYYTSNFFNADFQEIKSYDEERITIKYYENQPQNLLFAKASLNVPLSEWTTSRNYALHKLWRKIKFWR